MTPALREALVAADAHLRRRDPVAARIVLDALAAGDPGAAQAPEFHMMTAQAFLQAGDPEAASRAAGHAIGQRPQLFEAHHLLGIALADLGQLDRAAQSLERALALRPGHIRTCVNLGAVYRRSGQPEKAVSLCRQATDGDPAYALAWRGLAESLQAIDKEEAALEAWERWGALIPGRAEAEAGIGWAFTRARRWDDAERRLAVATALPDADHHADVLLGFVRRERGDIDGALAAYRRGAERSPGALTPRVAAELVLPPVYSGTGDLARWRRRYAGGIERLQNALPELLERPGAVWDLDWTNFYLGYQGGDDLPLQRAYADFVADLTRAAAPEWSESTPFGKRGGRLRVGFASSYFRRCTVGAYFASWLTQLDRERFEVFAFHFGNEVDDTTRALRTGVEHFVHAAGSVKLIAEKIRDAGLDVLIYPQLGMDGRDAALASLRLAPGQCVAWGHPVTTGSSAIDWYFSCEDMEPGDAASHYRERLLLLPGLGTDYRCPDVRPASRNDFGLPESVRLYVCPQSLFKIHPDNDLLFCEMLEEDAGGQLVFCAEPGQPITRSFQQRLRGAMSARGLDYESRVQWQPMRKEPDFRSMLSTCDVLLDTLHWSGGNTSLDALAAGLPIVTHPGRFLRGRQSAAMLRIVGLPELVAERRADIAPIAARVADDPLAIRKHIAAHRGLLFGRREPIGALAEHLLQIADRAV